MKTRLIALSRPTEQTGCNSAEELVAYCARVSNPANQASKQSATKLVRYLIENDHWSPLEIVHVVIEIETTRDIARQLLRHRSFSFQEFSQRYAEVAEFAEPREARLQDAKNRQNSVETDDLELRKWWNDCQIWSAEAAELLYKKALEEGIAKEVARSVLPEGLTTSRLYMAGTLRSWLHFCQLRMGNGTQKECREVAESCWAILVEQFPSIAGLVQKDELDELVVEFSKALLKKLKYQRDEKGYAGWNDPSWDTGEMWDDLREHVLKGDPVDVAAYAAFIHKRSQ